MRVRGHCARVCRPQVDSLRVLTSTTHEMLQKVPPCTESCKADGASTPSSKLLFAIESFQTRDIRSTCDDTAAVVVP